MQAISESEGIDSGMIPRNLKSMTRLKVVLMTEIKSTEEGVDLGMGK